MVFQLCRKTHFAIGTIAKSSNHIGAFNLSSRRSARGIKEMTPRWIALFRLPIDGTGLTPAFIKQKTCQKYG
jgi:hypothetical protein